MGWRNEWVDRKMDRLMNNRWVDGKMNECQNEWMEVDEWMMVR